ncbi:MAG: hypothetical protein CHACPFDD_00449 [Phycisphaerae bacterium]|nr:hypothetical protein [Phycisphaerae bacterium]
MNEPATNVDPTRRTHVARGALVGGAAVVALLALLVAFQLYPSELPKRFAPVVDGQIYRSGRITPEQLAHVQRTYGVRTVLSLLNPDAPECAAEREAARELGLEWHNVPLPGDGESNAEQRDEILRVMRDAQHGPLLVHCAAGATRTGLAVGLYRIAEQGWPLEAALDEMRGFGFEDEPHHASVREALSAAAEASRPRSPPE